MDYLRSADCDENVVTRSHHALEIHLYRLQLLVHSGGDIGTRDALWDMAVSHDVIMHKNYVIDATK